MVDAEIEIHVEGIAAEDLAMDLFELVDRRLGVKPRVERPPPPEGAQHRGPDPALAISVLSLIVSVPSAVLSTTQIVEWLKARRGRATTASPEGRIVRITVRGLDTTAIVNEEDARDAVELLAQAAGEDQPKATRR